MKKSTVFLLSAMLLFLGIVIGFLSAPIKHGVSIGNNSGNNSANSSANKGYRKHRQCCGEHSPETEDDETEYPS